MTTLDGDKLIPVADAIAEMLRKHTHEEGVTIVALTVCMLTSFKPEKVKNSLKGIEMLALRCCDGSILASRNN